MRAAGRVVGGVLRELAGRVKPGVTTRELDAFAEGYIRDLGATPAFLGYNGYPASICASVNEQVVHGIPSQRVLVEGDIIGVDVGAVLNGFVGDAARTFAVGGVSPEALKLMRVTQEALDLGIAAAVHGGHVQDIGAAVQAHAESQGFSVVRDFVGHGIGRKMHEDPQIPNYGRRGLGPKLKAGMTLAIEPMLNAGGHAVEVLKDGWTVVTRDARLSAHFEDTVIVTEDKPQILTRLD